MIEDGTLNRIKKLFERLNIFVDLSTGFDEDLNQEFLIIECPETKIEDLEEFLEEVVRAENLVDDFMETK